MLNDYEIARLLQQQYDGTPDVFDVTIDVSGVYCSVKNFPAYSVICFRGSATILDWCRDLQGVMVPDAVLGGVEQGFIQGVRDTKAHLETIIPVYTPVVICGHSLGAAHAALFAALWKLEGEEIPRVVLFGCPRPGGEKLKKILKSLSVASYCNGRDPVCRVPVDIPLIDPYCEPADFIMLNEPPAENDPWGEYVGWHHLSSYINGVKKVVGL